MKFTVYPDGSGINIGGLAGVAFVALDERGVVDLESALPLKYAKNHSAEVLAACYALRELPPRSAIVVWSDSEHLVKGWNKWRPNWLKNGWRTSSGADVVNRPYFERLIDLVDRHALVEFNWLPDAGHVHHVRADRLAREARARAEAAPDEAFDGV